MRRHGGVSFFPSRRPHPQGARRTGGLNLHTFLFSRLAFFFASIFPITTHFQTHTSTNCSLLHTYFSGWRWIFLFFFLDFSPPPHKHTQTKHTPVEIVVFVDDFGEIAIITIVIIMIIILWLVDAAQPGRETRRDGLHRYKHVGPWDFFRSFPREFASSRREVFFLRWQMLASSITEIMFYSYFYRFVNIDKKWLFRSRGGRIFRLTWPDRHRGACCHTHVGASLRARWRCADLCWISCFPPTAAAAALLLFTQREISRQRHTDTGTEWPQI